MEKLPKSIPFSRPSLGKEEEEAVLEVLRSGWLTTGPKALSFEKEFAKYVGSRFALAVNSATAGLHLSVEALGLKPGDWIITTPYTFAATAEIVRYCQAHPLFVDIEEDSLNIDPLLVEKALKNSSPVKAIIPVHLAGLPCKIEELKRLSLHSSVPLIEDCAHAFPVKNNDRFLGTYGFTGVFSFYANKTITTGEGGMVVTDDPEAYQRMKIMRLHGIDRDAWDRYYGQGQSNWYYEIVAAGFKYNLTDLAAAIGLVQLTKAQSLQEKRAAIAKRYLDGLADCDFLKMPLSHPQHAWHLFIIRLVPERLTLNRNEFVQELAKAGIGFSVHYISLHLMPYYQKLYGFKPEDFPVALRCSQTAISLPIFPDLAPDEVALIINTIKDIGCKYYKPRFS